MTRYNQEIETTMLIHFHQLGEKSKRHYAAVETLKLGYGGQKYISDLFGISPFRIRTGVRELQNPNLLSEIRSDKQRRIGGGRKKKKKVSPS
jgi:hypothetical protein